jgi:hypothetical protein
MKGMGEGACIGEKILLIDVFIYDLLEMDHWREVFLGGWGLNRGFAVTHNPSFATSLAECLYIVYFALEM